MGTCASRYYPHLSKHDRHALVSGAGSAWWRCTWRIAIRKAPVPATFQAARTVFLVGNKRRSVLQLGSGTRVHDLLGIDRVLVHLLFHDLSIFTDQEVHAAWRLIFVFID